MNKSYQQQLIVITMKFYLLLLHLPCQFKNQLPILCQIFQIPCHLWTILFCVTASNNVVTSWATYHSRSQHPGALNDWSFWVEYSNRTRWCRLSFLLVLFLSFLLFFNLFRYGICSRSIPRPRSFLSGLFYDALRISGYIELNCTVNDEFGKDLEGSVRRIIEVEIPALAWIDWVKPSRTSGYPFVLADVGIRHYPVAS